MEKILAKFSFYHKKYEIIKRGHHLAAEYYSRRNVFLGGTVGVLTALVGTAIFATLQSDPTLYYKVVTGITSIFAAILSALHTHLNYNEKAESHRMAGIKYSAIRRQFDTLHLKYSTLDNPDKAHALTELESLLKTIEELAEKMPAIPDKFSFQARTESKANETQ